MGVSLDSAVKERLWPFDVGDEATVREGESSSVTDVHSDVSESGRHRAGGIHL